MTESSGVGAVFAKIGRMTYQPDDAADAWQRIFAFFGRYRSSRSLRAIDGSGSWWIWLGGMLAASSAAVIATMAGGPQM